MDQDYTTVHTVSIFALVGVTCATEEDGQKVNEVVQVLLNDGCAVRLDFHMVKLITRSFYRAVVGDLHTVFPDTIDRRLVMANLPDHFLNGSANG